MALPGKTTGLNSWHFQDNYVERLLDSAAYTSAHPDDTLLLAGPARFGGGTGDGRAFDESLYAIGMVQGFSASQGKPLQPLMAIGSGRQFYAAGKAQTQWSITRLFVNGRNLLKALYHNAETAGIDVSKFDDPAAAASSNENFWINLDSELFLIPFGLAFFFRDKVHNKLGAFYMELCAIQSWSIQVAAGGNTIAENVSGLADRLIPIYPSQFDGTNWSASTYSDIDQRVLGVPNQSDAPTNSQG